MNEKRIKYLLDPINELFGVKECGYCLVVPKDKIISNSAIQSNFQSEGGIIIPFYANRTEYKKDVVQIKFKNSL